MTSTKARYQQEEFGIPNENYTYDEVNHGLVGAGFREEHAKEVLKIVWQLPLPCLRINRQELEEAINMVAILDRKEIVKRVHNNEYVLFPRIF